LNTASQQQQQQRPTRVDSESSRQIWNLVTWVEIDCRFWTTSVSGTPPFYVGTI